MENYQDVLSQMELFGIELRDKDLPLRLDKGKRVTCGKGGKDWYKLYLFTPQNTSKQWVTGTFGTYRAGGDWRKVLVDWAELSEEERARMKAEREAKKAAAAAERAQEIANASADALTIWRKAVATETTPYLERKQVQAMNSRKNNLAAMLSCALISIALSACGSMPNDGPRPTARKPKPTPLPAAILQIDSKPTTDTLLRASKWLQDSEVILQGETTR